MVIVVGIDVGFAHAGMVACRLERAGTSHMLVPYDAVTVTSESALPARKKNEKGKLVRKKVEPKEGESSRLVVALDRLTRTKRTARELMAFLDKHRPSAVFAELPTSGGKSAAAVTSMAMASGAMAVISDIRKEPFVWVAPIESKLAVMGKTDASKDEMMDRIRSLYPVDIWPKTKGNFEHCADAMAAIVASMGHPVYLELVRQVQVSGS
jgi:Holliday junction resolvasome RuvABC endonuclease subunit